MNNTDKIKDINDFKFKIRENKLQYLIKSIEFKRAILKESEEILIRKKRRDRKDRPDI